MSLYPLSYSVTKTPRSLICPFIMTHAIVYVQSAHAAPLLVYLHLQQDECRITSSSRPNKTSTCPSSVSCRILAVKHRVQSESLMAGTAFCNVSCRSFYSMSTRVRHTPFNAIRCFRMSRASQLLSPHAKDGDGHSTEYGSEGKCSLIATEIHKCKQRGVLKSSRAHAHT